MVNRAVERPEDRRPLTAGGVSIALHGCALVAVIAFAGRSVAPAPHRFALTSVEIVSAPPRPEPSSPRREVAPTAPPSVVRPAATRTPRVAAPRTRPTAQAPEPSLADMTVSYDDASDFADPRAAAGEGDAVPRVGVGVGVDHGLAALEIPAPAAAASLARPLRTKHDYRKLRLPNASQFAGQVIKVWLEVDAKGRVRDVRLMKGVDRDLDRRVMQLVRSFEFEPALDDTGAPLEKISPWTIEIEDDDPFHRALERGHY